MTELWIALAVAALLCAVGLLALGFRNHGTSGREKAPEGALAGENPMLEPAAVVRRFPASGILVPEAVLSSAGENTSVWEALECAAVPLAFEYYPITDVELTSYKSIPVNAATQQALTDIVRTVDPSSATLFRAVLPKGAELVRAVGTTGFRGFARGPANIRSHAVLYPVGVGGAAVAGWPILAVASSVMAMDMLAQREQRAHQRRVETILGRQEQRYEVGRMAAQRTTDQRLSEAISRMLDGQLPELDVAEQRAGEEFHQASQFFERTLVILKSLDAEGEGAAVDYHTLETALGGRTKDLDHFARELHFARAGVALGRKALLAGASSAALADPQNPYLAFRSFLERRASEVEQVEQREAKVTSALTTLQFSGHWYDSKKSIADRQAAFRRRIAPPPTDQAGTVQYLALPSGEIHQLVPVETASTEDEATLPSTTLTKAEVTG